MVCNQTAQNFRAHVAFGNTRLEDLVFSLGRDFPIAPRPDGVRQMQEKVCYRNAYLLSALRGWTYCEGFAWGSERPAFGTHAWCCTPEGIVADPTWPYRADRKYFGIPFRPAYVEKVIGDRDEYVSLIDDWIEEWPLLRLNPADFVKAL
jgi:hypothetical protein